jgi:hypothetical protein
MSSGASAAGRLVPAGLTAAPPARVSADGRDAFAGELAGRPGAGVPGAAADRGRTVAPEPDPSPSRSGVALSYALYLAGDETAFMVAQPGRIVDGVGQLIGQLARVLNPGG